MKVFKFGGASIKDAKAVENVKQIISQYQSEHLLIVVSAMAKTTNAFERIVDLYIKNPKAACVQLQEIKDFHYHIAEELFPKEHEVFNKINDLIEDISLKLKVEASLDYDYEYDQIVVYGELLSSLIIHNYLKYKEVDNEFIDIRKCIKTNSRYRYAEVDYNLSEQLVTQKINFKNNGIYLTQGFIASTKSNISTTLGREGSDFTGAVLANILNAESLTIWKDVPGILNADPKLFDNTALLPGLSYAEAVELAFYGAKVIHPKTIKPLQNKKIPLYVKSFFNYRDIGSVVSEDTSNDRTIPSYILLKNRVLISLAPRDYSFINEKNLSDIFGALAELGLRINVMQNSAISFSFCIKYDELKLERLLKELKPRYKVLYNKGLELLTIRNYTNELLVEYGKNRNILLEQRSRHTVRLVYKKNKEFSVK